MRVRSLAASDLSNLSGARGAVAYGVGFLCECGEWYRFYAGAERCCTGKG